MVTKFSSLHFRYFKLGLNVTNQLRRDQASPTARLVQVRAKVVFGNQQYLTPTSEALKHQDPVPRRYWLPSTADKWPH